MWNKLNNNIDKTLSLTKNLLTLVEKTASKTFKK